MNQERYYCVHCERPITEQPYFSGTIWTDQDGTMFCKTSDDRMSLIAHKPKAALEVE